MTRDEIAALDDDELHEYLLDNARYDPRNKENPYAIWFGGSAIKSVRRYRANKADSV